MPWAAKVEQEYRAADFGYLGNETAFFTSRGNVITITGTALGRAVMEGVSILD